MDLTPRLKKISELIPQKSVLADIGTDHAYLPVYCVLNGISQRAVAMDVNEGPLLRAEENVKKYGLCKQIELRRSDGIEALLKNEADVIVIAGMGGLLIKKILDSGIKVLSNRNLLILQPMNAVKELREYLYRGGFCVENEYVASEGNKMYNIIACRYGVKCNFSEYDIIIGRNLKKNCPALFNAYASAKAKTLKKIIKGMESSAENHDTSKVKHEFELYMKELDEN